MDKWSNSCRSCLQRAEHFSHFIYEHISPQQYFYCTSVEVNREDALPKAICDDCYDLINKFIKFKTRCILSENKLLRLSQSSLLKDEPCSNLEVEKGLVEDTWREKSENKNKPGINSFLKIEMKEDAEEEILSDINDDVTGTDAPDTDIEDHIEATKVSATELQKPKKTIVKKPKNFQCEQCNRKFSFKERLEGHMLTHEGKAAPIECKECNKTLTTWGGLHRHIESCHSHIPFKDVTCQVCSKVCKTPDTLRVHLRMHKEGRERVCDECGKTFKSAITFKNHLETHTIRSLIYPCEHCGKRYINKKTRARHISRRHTDKKFICDYCNYVFTDRTNLIRHVMIHEGRNPKYRCDICSRTLTSQASLIVHKRTHTSEKPFSCSHCPKRFSERAWLVEHERNHTGEKPFHCAVCSLRFSRRGSMRRHMKVHKWEGCQRKYRGGP